MDTARNYIRSEIGVLIIGWFCIFVLINIVVSIKGLSSAGGALFWINTLAVPTCIFVSYAVFAFKIFGSVSDILFLIGRYSRSTFVSCVIGNIGSFFSTPHQMSTEAELGMGMLIFVNIIALFLFNLLFFFFVIVLQFISRIKFNNG